MKLGRLKKELEILQNNPPPGISCWPKGDQMSVFEAQIIGSDGTPFEKGNKKIDLIIGIFQLDVTLPDRYPLEPPLIRFKTPIFHPNIDGGGRICLDVLNLPPKGSWKPSWNISTVLTSIQLLMSNPNPDDGLMADITKLYKENISEYNKQAKLWTEKHAIKDKVKDKI